MKLPENTWRKNDILFWTYQHQRCREAVRRNFANARVQKDKESRDWWNASAREWGAQARFAWSILMEKIDA